jgi:uncharacterized protein YbcI
MVEHRDTHDLGPSTSVARALAAAMKRRYGKGPLSARGHFIEDDILVVVMRDPATAAERSMAEAGRERDAREFRLAFQNAYEGEIKGIAEEHIGRKVATYHSQIVFDPDLLFEIFIFESSEVSSGST